MVSSLSGRVIMEVAYGIEVQEKNDPWIATAEHALEGATVTGIPGSFMVDIIPICQCQLLLSSKTC